MNEKTSQLKKVIKKCPTLAMTKALMQKYRQEYRDSKGRLPLRAKWGSMHRRAMCVALRKTAWLSHETTSKLLRLQNQDYNRPHPTAFSVDKRYTAI
jgi:hypothetical protein